MSSESGLVSSESDPVSSVIGAVSSESGLVSSDSDPVSY